MRFSKTNLCTELATTITASSSNSNFPVSNLKNDFRSKRWRSKGTFVVDSTNNKIDFEEFEGTELTATIQSGSYSTSELVSEIKTQLEAVGEAEYEITYNQATGLWNIQSINGEHFTLLNNTGTNQAANLLKQSLGFPNTDLVDELEYTGSLIAIHTEESVVFDFKTSQDITCITLLWPKEDGIRLSENAILKIQANATNVWESPAVDQVLTINNTYMVASHFFSEPQEYRYWRVVIKDPTNPNLFVELGQVWIGEDLGFNEPENGFKFKLNDRSLTTKTDFGHEYVDEYPLEAQVDFNYKYVGYEVAQALEDAYRENGNRKPVLVVFDQDEVVFDKDHFLVYGKMGKSFQLDHVVYDLFEGGLRITELG